MGFLQPPQHVTAVFVCYGGINMNMITTYSRIYSLICSVLDRLRFIQKNCYVSQSVAIQVEHAEKEMTEALEILDGKEIIKEDINQQGK